MICAYLRSSSVGSYSYCNLQYLFQYVFGWHSPSSKKASKGNCVHKALELLGAQKLAQQKNETTFYNDELDLTFRVGEMSPEYALELGYNHYKQDDWDERDRRDCEKWLWNVLEYNEGAYDPRKRHVLEPELFFDLTIEDEWAAFNYSLPGGGRLSGQLGLKGTMDMVTLVGPKTIELLDWKTGRRTNWNTGKPKEYDDFFFDFQLRLYFLALSQLYPGYTIHVTIFFAADGGPFSIAFGPEDLPETKELIRKKFEAIRDDNRPKATPNKWKCGICHFKPRCEEVREELYTLGMDAVVAKHADLTKLNSYTGGGRSNRETKS